jgi:CheY-specific phosphatase CheX
VPEAVCEAEFHRALADSVEEVLYKMFFIEALAEPAPAPAGAPADELSAALRFEGRPSGGLKLAVSRPAARSIAADFLAEDESVLDGRQVAEVICELANMICGAMLSRVESEETFRLSAPRVCGEGEGDDCSGRPTIRHALDIGRGTLRVAVYTDAP